MKISNLRDLADTYTFLADKAFQKSEKTEDERMRSVVTARALAYRVAADLANNLLSQLEEERAAVAAWWEDERISNSDAIA